MTFTSGSREALSDPMNLELGLYLNLPERDLPARFPRGGVLVAGEVPGP